MAGNILEGGRMTQHDRWGQAEELKATAYHEAAHAVIDTHIGLPMTSVDIRRESGDLGGCQGEMPAEAVAVEVDFRLNAADAGNPMDPATMSAAARDWIDKMIRSKLAGPLAEIQFRGRVLQGAELFAAGGDTDDMQKLARVRWPDAERRQRLREAGQQIANLIRDPAIWRAIEAVAQELLRRKFLTGDEVRQLYQAAMSS
jgi:hypothetical protein